jgi:serine protease
MLACVAVAVGMAGYASASAAAPASAAANPYAPNYHSPARHGALPTREQLVKMQGWDSAHHSGAIPADSANNLVFRGGNDGIGVTIGTPKVYIVFWGSGWGTQSTDANGNLTFSNDPNGAAPKVQNMFKGAGTGGELWSGTSTQYCEGVPTGTQICGTAGNHVGYPTGGDLAGVWYDSSSGAGTTTQHQIAAEAVTAASHFGNTTPALNRSSQYVIMSASGAHPDNFNAPLQWCAWHDWNGDTTLTGGPAPSTVGDIAFSNMPYVLDAGASCGENFVNGGSAGILDGFTIVEGHEYNETLTDQNPAGGYTDSGGSEIGDKCAWITPGTAGGAGNVTFGNGTYPEQSEWSNDSASGTGACELTHPIVTGGPSFTMSASPSSGSVVAGNSTTSTITVTETGGNQTVTLSASGLPAGATAGFNPTSLAASGTSTLTLTTATSTPNGTYPITITGTGTSTSSTTYTLTVTGGTTSDFSISDSPTSLSLTRGTSGTVTVSTALVSGSAQTITLSISGVPSRASATFNPSSVTTGGSSTLTIHAGSRTPRGTYTLTIKGTSSTASHTVTLTLTVS